MKIVFSFAIGLSLMLQYLFPLYRENRTYCWNVSSVTWNVSSVIWSTLSVTTTKVPIKKLKCVWCKMLKNFKGPLKIKGKV
jgi:hypothetical protein